MNSCTVVRKTTATITRVRHHALRSRRSEKSRVTMSSSNTIYAVEEKIATVVALWAVEASIKNGEYDSSRYNWTKLS